MTRWHNCKCGQRHPLLGGDHVFIKAVQCGDRILLIDNQANTPAAKWARANQATSLDTEERLGQTDKKRE
jgi:hypothetical protein